MPFSDLDPLPVAPQRGDDPDTFADLADAYVVALTDFSNQLNVFISELETAAALIDAAPSYSDAGLVSIATLDIAADEMLYGTAADTFGKATLTTFARTLLDDADGAAARTTLGLGSIATANNINNANWSGTDLAVANGGTGASTAATARTNLGLTDLVCPSGAVMAFAMNVPPPGWLDCDGAAVSRTTYADLFAAIGTTFGVGDGSTTFNVPDLRGEFVRGWDDGKGTDSGRGFGTSQADELESHSHDIRYHVRNIDGSDNEGDGVLFTGASYTSGYIEATGGTETRPRNIALLYGIKT